MGLLLAVHVHSLSSGRSHANCAKEEKIALVTEHLTPRLASNIYKIHFPSFLRVRQKELTPK